MIIRPELDNNDLAVIRDCMVRAPVPFVMWKPVADKIDAAMRAAQEAIKAERAKREQPPQPSAPPSPSQPNRRAKRAKQEGQE